MEMPKILTELGINAGLIVAGLFGSLLNLNKSSAKRLGPALLSLATGVGSANYLTPVVIDVLNINGRNFEFGIAFIMGYLGLNGIEYAIGKLLKK